MSIWAGCIKWILRKWIVDLWIWNPDSTETGYSPVAVYPWALLSNFGLCKSGECLVAVSNQQLWKNSPESWIQVAFRRFRKIAKSNCRLRHVCPSVCPQKQLCCQCKNFYKIWYLSIFRKSVEKIQVQLKSGKNYKYFTWRTMYICNHSSLTSS